MRSVAIGANKDAEHLPDGKKVTDQAKADQKESFPWQITQHWFTMTRESYIIPVWGVFKAT